MTTPRPVGTPVDPPRGCGPAWGGPALDPLYQRYAPYLCTGMQSSQTTGPLLGSACSTG